MQAVHGVKGVTLIRLIKAWARFEGRRDKDIFDLHANSNPAWPWSENDPPTARINEDTQSMPLQANP
jgi:hypothetical protein